jgi:hypothetical protein
MIRRERPVKLTEMILVQNWLEEVKQAPQAGRSMFECL